METLTTVLYVFCTAIRIFLSVLETAMFLRALLSWFIMDEENGFMRILWAVTEPAIMPVRALLNRFGVGEDSPVDIAFFVTMILLMILGVILPAVPVA